MKIKAEDFNLFVCNKYYRLYPNSLKYNPNSLKYNTNFICSQFYDYKFLARLVGPSLTLISFSKIKTSKSQKHFLQRSHGHQECCLTRFEDKHRITRISCQAIIVPKRREHGMKTRSVAKAAMVVVVR